MQKKCGAAYPSLSLELSSLTNYRGQKIKNEQNICLCSFSQFFQLPHTSFYRPMFTANRWGGQLNYSCIIPSISGLQKTFYQTG